MRSLCNVQKPILLPRDAQTSSGGRGVQLNHSWRLAYLMQRGFFLGSSSKLGNPNRATAQFLLDFTTTLTTIEFGGWSPPPPHTVPRLPSAASTQRKPRTSPQEQCNDRICAFAPAPYPTPTPTHKRGRGSLRIIFRQMTHHGHVNHHHTQTPHTKTGNESVQKTNIIKLPLSKHRQGEKKPHG